MLVATAVVSDRTSIMPALLVFLQASLSKRHAWGVLL
eukprot:CAMPEP_0197692632 /NCGR_PEP_ID=MMETSP1338-20131121/111389_1 /TAXON_ID=43686 ORGANISM="Pelagodinium beii, Strain RCC1491" /NCGR_SAMPLE_ID=MMETSP1338 /ASSEMBLY_ACC=CAM_ASM_000754 /LENGTH=36 /DNA_ID= /DNA_START= /DNA_END= /DNA_ORIENTATION=